MIYLYLFGTCFHFIYVFMIIGNKCVYIHDARMIFMIWSFFGFSVKVIQYFDSFACSMPFYHSAFELLMIVE